MPSSLCAVPVLPATRYPRIWALGAVPPGCTAISSIIRSAEGAADLPAGAREHLLLVETGVRGEHVDGRAQRQVQSLARRGAERRRRVGEGVVLESPDGDRPRVGTLAQKAYETLSLEIGADSQTVRLRYKELVKRFHPDANGGDRSLEDRLREIIHAYNTLKAAGLA